MKITRTIAIPKGYPIIHDFLRMDIGHHIKVVNIICAIWIIGSFVILGYKLSDSIRQLKIKKYGLHQFAISRRIDSSHHRSS